MTIPNEPQDTGQEPQNEGGDDWGGNFNPKWETVLSQIPPELHAKVAPELAKWDRGVQQQFQKYAPWKDVLSSGVEPSAAQQAILLAKSMQEDPRGVYDAMGKHYNFAQQAQAALEQAEEDLEEANPWEAGYKQLQDKVDLLSRVILASHEKEQQSVRERQEDAELDKALKAAAAKYGDAWNEQTALKLVQGFSSVEEAYDFYLQGGRQQQRPAPRVMGTGSTFPQFGNKRPSDLNDTERTTLIAQMIEDMKRA